MSKCFCVASEFHGNLLRTVETKQVTGYRRHRYCNMSVASASLACHLLVQWRRFVPEDSVGVGICGMKCTASAYATALVVKCGLFQIT